MIQLAEILLEAHPTPFWRMLRQVGVEHAVGVLPRRPRDWRGDEADHPWDLAPLSVYQAAVEGEGLHLAVIEDNPPMDRLRLGRPGRDEEFEQVATLVRNMGRLGIPVLCYNWSAALGWLRTELAVRGRGGALVAGYDHRRLRDAPPPRSGTADEDDLWANLRYFLGRIVPVAEQAGVRLAMHPDDPPLSPIRGMARIMRSVDAFQRLVDLVPSPANAITLCQGNFALMTDDLPAVIRRFAAQDAIAFVHFRDVRGTPERFVETFHDEGPTDMLACLRAYREAGFDGPLRTDHNPTLEGDHADVPGYSPLGRLHAIGYVQGLREAAYAQPGRG
ncbi:MAG: mannonate dehydratase [Solirubrobacteraceae bacterium]